MLAIRARRKEKQCQEEEEEEGPVKDRYEKRHDARIRLAVSHGESERLLLADVVSTMAITLLSFAIPRAGDAATRFYRVA